MKKKVFHAGIFIRYAEFHTYQYDECLPMMMISGNMEFMKKTSEIDTNDIYAI
ncbi:MAG: hypothetical protein R2769_16900 [Saprospiraceae bacterium]